MYGNTTLTLEQQIEMLRNANNERQQVIERLTSEVDSMQLTLERLTIDRDQQIEKLLGDITQLQNYCTAYRSEISDLRNDAQHIAQSLLDEAEARDWCSEYDRFVGNVNASLRRVELIQREREYEIAATATVTFRYTVTAASEDQAYDIFDNTSFDLPSSYGSMYSIDVTDITIDDTIAL